MVRNYKRKPGARPYRTAYSQESLDEALHLVKKKGKSIRGAAKLFRIPHATLYSKSKGLHTKKVGRPLQLSEEFRSALLQAILALAKLNVPVTRSDLKVIVKGYLDRRGIVHKVFVNNTPGDDWVSNFVKSNGLITEIISGKVKTLQAKVSSDTIREYFENLADTIEGIPPERIYTYDEASMTDNPDAVNAIVPTGGRQVERKMDRSKSAISVMFCGSATGLFVPPMVVYKAEKLRNSWTKGGPHGTIYATTKSGLFDTDTFELWFKNVFINHLGERHATSPPVVLLGDYSPSHISRKVIKRSLTKNIIVVTVPPDSAHMTLPLDVEVFKPMKVLWRQIMSKWRVEANTKKSPQKQQFPLLLGSLFKSLDPVNLISGFAACGIVPFDENRVLEKFSSMNKSLDGNTTEVLNDSVLSFLKAHFGQDGAK